MRSHPRDLGNSVAHFGKAGYYCWCYRQTGVLVDANAEYLGCQAFSALISVTYASPYKRSSWQQWTITLKHSIV
jgi:hypothetical protein